MYLTLLEQMRAHKPNRPRIMKKSMLIALLVFLCLSSAFAQGGRFLIRIEDNYANNWVSITDGREDGFYNTDSKKGVEKRFFGDFNAKVEYFLEPSFEPATGFRIYRDSLGKSYLLEVKKITNYDKVNKQLNNEFPLQGGSTLEELSGERGEQMAKHNGAMIAKLYEERPKRYEIDAKAIPVSDAFAEKVYAKVSTMIDTFAPTEKPPQIYDGYRATFRCVAGLEVWTFTIHCPAGDVKKLSNLFKTMISAIDDGSFNETRYMSLLEE